MTKTFINPPTLGSPPGYSHVVTVEGGRLIILAGQVSLDAKNKLVGKGDLAAQTRQVFENIGLALHAAGASFRDVIKLTYFVVDYKPEYRETIVAVRDQYVAVENPPASTLLGVQALATPDFLIEIEATAFVG
ncbi:MAG: RidA family protein [Anaerolineae bacterium]|nr:RidA family protein [Anaerolineae bacterium]